MRYLPIAALLMFCSMQAAAQSTNHPNDTSQKAALSAGGKADCKPRSIKGRYRLYLEGASSFCTLEITGSGRVLKQDDPVTVCRGLEIDSPVLGGRLTRHAPLPNGRRSGQCWLNGAIEVNQGDIEILEAFMMTRRSGFAGVYIGPDGAPGTFLAVRY